MARLNWTKVIPKGDDNSPQTWLGIGLLPPQALKLTGLGPVHLKSKPCSARNVTRISPFLMFSSGENSIQTEMFPFPGMKCHLLYLLEPYIVSL